MEKIIMIYYMHCFHFSNLNLTIGEQKTDGTLLSLSNVLSGSSGLGIKSIGITFFGIISGEKMPKFLYMFATNSEQN